MSERVFMREGESERVCVCKRAGWRGVCVCVYVCEVPGWRDVCVYVHTWIKGSVRVRVCAYVDGGMYACVYVHT